MMQVNGSLHSPSWLVVTRLASLCLAAQLGSTFARFRLHSATGPGLHPGGVASKGEVEDHRVVITFDVNDPAEVAKLMASDAAKRCLLSAIPLPSLATLR